MSVPAGLQEHVITEEALQALNQAVLAVAGNLTLDKTLRQIVESARVLAGARYAALGVPNSEGVLVEFVHSGIEPPVAHAIGQLPQGYGLLGAIITEARTIRIPHIREDPRSYGFPKNHPEMESFLGVPIRAGEVVLGNLYLTEKVGAAEFTGIDQQLVEFLAAHAAIAIQNARLYEQVGRLAVVEERSRIGMDLHDGFIQAVYAVGLTLESARLLLPPEQSESIELIGQGIAGLNDAITDIRNFILDLRPRRFEGNLNQGLARLAREFQANTMVPVMLDVPDEATASLPPAVSRALFLTTQEALANIARHARASTVLIAVERNPQQVQLVVQDDGVGFDPSAQTMSTGHGLANMKTRAEERDGSFELDSAPGRGTRVCFRVPLQRG